MADYTIHDPEKFLAQTDKSNGGGNAPPLVVLSKADFIAGYVAPDYLVDGVLQRRFLYALTGATNHGKTALALLIAQLVASQNNAALGHHPVERGQVCYFVGENPDDLRMRVIGADGARTDDVSQDRISFIPGVFNIDEMLNALTVEMTRLGGVDLVIVDTSAAYFLGNEELSNTEMGRHARMLRKLTKLPNGPCVLVLCHPIKHVTDPSQLLPRGGGAFLAEIDTNLTCWRHDETLVQLHHGKIRGPGFEPITFKLEKITTPRLIDSKGRLVPTVRAFAISESEEESQADRSRADEDQLLLAMRDDADRSQADLAKACGWTLQTGEGHKSKVYRLLQKLRDDKLVRHGRGDHYELTEAGKQAVKRIATEIENETPPQDQPHIKFHVVGPADADAVCEQCREEGDVWKIRKAGQGTKTRPVHKACAPAFFSRNRG